MELQRRKSQVSPRRNMKATQGNQMIQKDHMKLQVDPIIKTLTHQANQDGEKSLLPREIQHILRSPTLHIGNMLQIQTQEDHQFQIVDMEEAITQRVVLLIRNMNHLQDIQIHLISQIEGLMTAIRGHILMTEIGLQERQKMKR